MNKLLFSLVLFICAISNSYAEWVITPTTGAVESVRTYQAGTNGLRAQITMSGVSHTCGNAPNTFYFDTGNVPTEVVKSVLSLAFGAMAANKPARVTFECVPENNYGWGKAITVFK